MVFLKWNLHPWRFFDYFKVLSSGTPFLLDSWCIHFHSDAFLKTTVRTPIPSGLVNDTNPMTRFGKSKYSNAIFKALLRLTYACVQRFFPNASFEKTRTPIAAVYSVMFPRTFITTHSAFKFIAIQKVEAWDFWTWKRQFVNVECENLKLSISHSFLCPKSTSSNQHLQFNYDLNPPMNFTFISVLLRTSWSSSRHVNLKISVNN